MMLRLECTRFGYSAHQSCCAPFGEHRSLNFANLGSNIILNGGFGISQIALRLQMDKEELLRIIAQTINGAKRELNLTQRNLSWLPPDIERLTRLARLVLAQNQLTELPPEIGQLTN